MHTKLTSLIDRFFKDNDGKWAVIQFPNILLSAWIILTAVLFFVDGGTIGDGIRLLQNSVLFAWAYGEASTGTSYFRRFLGVVILVAVVLGYFLR